MVVFDAHPALLMKVIIELPAPIPKTTPDGFTIATAILLLVQVPPDEGLSIVVAPIHSLADPLLLIGVRPLIVITLVASDGHSVVLFVKVKVAVPPLTPVTTPAFVTAATAVLLLAQVPPEVGLNVVVDPSHIVLAPVILPLVLH